MKHYLIIILSIIAVLCTSSCKEKKSKFRQIEDFQSTLTAEDTTQMLKLSDDCMELLKNKQIDAALAGLHEYDPQTNELKPLSEASRKRFQHMFKIFPVLEYKREYFSFQLEGENDVKYSIVFAEADKDNNMPAARTAMMFNPVKYEGVWYLTVKTADEDFDHLKN